MSDTAKREKKWKKKSSATDERGTVEKRMVEITDCFVVQEERNLMKVYRNGGEMDCVQFVGE